MISGHNKMNDKLKDQLQHALARVAKLEEELNDRDRQLEVVITDHDQDIVDMRKSFEVEMFKKPSLRASIDLARDECPHCAEMQKLLKIYQKQWSEINRNFRQVPKLLEGMIARTDKLVCNITKAPPIRP